METLERHICLGNKKTPTRGLEHCVNDHNVEYHVGSAWKISL